MSESVAIKTVEELERSPEEYREADASLFESKFRLFAAGCWPLGVASFTLALI